MSAGSRELWAHASLALSQYVKAAGRSARLNGSTVPVGELLALAELFASFATVRQDATDRAPIGATGHAEPVKDHPLLSKKEAAAGLLTSTRTVERLIASGQLAAVKVQGQTRIRRVDLDAYVAALPPSRRSFRDTVTEKAATA